MRGGLTMKNNSLDKRILVCGTGFGKVYLNAISKIPGYKIAGILARGSERSLKLAEQFGVPLYSDPCDEKICADCACVVVPNAAGGGNGTEIAIKLLKRGIPTLLEHPAHEKEIVQCIRESGEVPFMLNPFYRYVDPIQDFLKAAEFLRKEATLLNASLNCAIHVLYDGLDILGCALGAIAPWKLGNVVDIPDVDAEMTKIELGKGNKTVGALVGGIPVSITVNTEIDGNDPDHPLHLYHGIELTFSTGRLCLVNTHGPVIWLPFLRIPRNQEKSFDLLFKNEELQIPSALIIGSEAAPNMEETFNVIWARGIKKALETLISQSKSDKIQSAQFQIFISRLWSEVSRKVGYSSFVSYGEQPSVVTNYREFRKWGIL